MGAWAPQKWVSVCSFFFWKSNLRCVQGCFSKLCLLKWSRSVFQRSVFQTFARAKGVFRFEVVLIRKLLTVPFLFGFAMQPVLRSCLNSLSWCCDSNCVSVLLKCRRRDGVVGDSIEISAFSAILQIVMHVGVVMSWSAVRWAVSSWSDSSHVMYLRDSSVWAPWMMSISSHIAIISDSV